MYSMKSESRFEILQERYDRLFSKYEDMKSEKKKLENDLAICKEKIKLTEKTYEDLKTAIQEARQIQADYKKAYDDLIITKSKYTSKVKALIEGINH